MKLRPSTLTRDMSKLGKAVFVVIALTLILIGSYALYQKQDCAKFCSDQGYDGSRATFRGCKCMRIVETEVLE